MKYIKLVILVTILALLFFYAKSLNKPLVENGVFKPKETSEYSVVELLSGLDRPWGIAFLPNGQVIFTERSNTINILKDGEVSMLNGPPDTFVNGEGGMMGVATDPKFSENRHIYVCFNSTKYEGTPRVVVSRFDLDLENNELVNRLDIISDIPANPSGRHSGCQLEFGPDGYLWIGTGDTANQPEPQDPKSLGGKILRVDKDGNPVEGNLNGGFDPRVYSYGHRNIQGLGFFANNEYTGMLGVSIEHGPDRDDEVNLLVSGNFGWDPLPYYGEAVPMTDKNKFPDAVDALWESGYPTIAASGGTVINSSKWGKWQNSIAVAALKGSHILILKIDSSGQVLDSEEILKNDYGRFRTIREGLDGSLYLLTDNGQGNDKILLMTPR